MATAICIAMRAVGMASVNPNHPDLKVLIDKGADIGLFVEVARECVKNGKPPKGKPDWAAIKADYRTDVLSSRELARLYGVKDGVIRNRAKAEGWERDLKAQVQERVVSELASLESSESSPEVRTKVRTVLTPYTREDEVRTSEVRTDREIIESVAARWYAWVGHPSIR
ncbi:MAG: hypothetical protein Q7K57_10960 [Burkholderiaceae bacterium]|nr:hypothetical protein [Burkholderiaceae bacterium]